MRTMLLLLLSGLALWGCEAEPTNPAEPPAPRDSDQVGPYKVSATTLRNYDDRGQLLTVEIWYPALPEPGQEYEPYEEDLSLAVDSYRDAPPDLRGAPYPTVAFSHGYGGLRFQSSYLCTWIASHGFVVLAVDHPHNTMLDLDPSAFAEVAARRPGDVRAAVDLVRRPATILPHIEGLVEPESDYAVIGHSFGAWTALVVGGGQLDRDALVQRCTDDPDQDGCRFVTEEAMQELEGLELGEPDPRAVVAVSLAPGLAYSFGPAGAGLAGNVPTLVHGGTRDTDLSYDSEIRPVFEALPSTSHLLTYADAGHFGFSDLCANADLLDECREGGGYMTVQRVHELSRTTTVAWLRSRWLGEGSQEAFLSSSYVEAEGDATWE